MAFGLFASFEPHVDTSALQTDGVALLDALEPLDNVATKARVMPLSTFTDQREVPDDFDGDPEDLDDVLGPRDDWHSIDSGLATVAALLKHLRSRPGPSIPEPALVTADLEALEACLRAAFARNPAALFRLEAG